jgi:hypothetical protein
VVFTLVAVAVVNFLEEMVPGLAVLEAAVMVVLVSQEATQQ